MKRTFITLMLFCSGLFFAQELTLDDLIKLSAYDAKAAGDFVSAKGYEPQAPYEYEGSELTEYYYNVESATDGYVLEREVDPENDQLYISWRSINPNYYSKIKKSLTSRGFQLKESKERKDYSYTLYRKNNTGLELLEKYDDDLKVRIYEITYYKDFKPFEEDED